MKPDKKYNLKGLESKRVQKLRLKFGKNILVPEKKDNFFQKILHIISEPMFLLLIGAAIIYFILGEPKDGIIMLVFVIGIIGIDIIQEWKTDKTLRALKDLSAPQVNVIRDGIKIKIPSIDLVPGDLMIITEGVKIPADGVIVRANDLCVNESSLTGEAEEVWKTTTQNVKPNNDYWRKDYCYAGTLVIQGSAYIMVDKTGANTEYGKIGANVSVASEDPTPLQKQTGKLVKLCAGIAALLFSLVGLITYINIPDHLFKARLIESILSGITLAMAMIPEEFPVILTVFLSMGAWRLAKKQALVHRLPAVETLGAISVLCVDKTGTITMNQMAVNDVWTFDCEIKELAKTMGLGCETEAYDPMEKAMHKYCESLGLSHDYLYGGKFLHEYPFSNENKIMGHVWDHENKIILAAKGSPEKIFSICKIPKHKLQVLNEQLKLMSQKGLRVIAVAKLELKNKQAILNNLEDYKLTFCGLVGLADPPRQSIKENIKICLEAGIRVIMMTGDNGLTANTIAKQVGIPNTNEIITGDDLINMKEDKLCSKVKRVSIFARVIPEHKMRIIQALKANGEIVAMTGDGVNDAPALKYADIGISMAKYGSEVSREAADLILLDDNFSTIVKTIKDGRRLYENIRKAIGYVFTIHIPIALSSLLAPLIGINPVSLMLLPLHIVLLELIIDPTCSIVLERQPAEDDVMKRKPRKPDENILTKSTLIKSIVQGLVIFIASFGTYYIILNHNLGDALLARTMGLVIIILANIFLVQVNSSNSNNIFKSFFLLAKDKVMWIVYICTFSGLMLILYTPIHEFLKISPLSFKQFFIALTISFFSVVWFEIVKFYKKQNNFIL